MLTTLSGVVVVIAFGITVFNALFAPRLRGSVPGTDRPSASLLVPARDEAENLERLLPSLAQASGLLEVLVLDDHSVDATADVVRNWAGRDPRIRLLKGEALPPGWTGKNWACQQLAREASGDLLIFCDADVWLTGDAVAATVDGLTRYDVLSAMPRHCFAGLFDAAVVPLVTQTLIVSLLPLSLVPRVPVAALSGATGQWLAFGADAYDALGGHTAVRERVLEDVEIVRAAKASGLTAALLLGHRSLEVKMYERRGEVVDGFTKNLYPLMGGTLVTFAFAMVGFYLLAIHPFIAALAGTWWLLVLLGGMRFLEIAMLRGSPRSALLHLPGAIFFLWIAARSALYSRRGRAVWKGRTLG